MLRASCPIPADKSWRLAGAVIALPPFGSIGAVFTVNGYRWPSRLFIPDDPFEIPCWDHTAYSVDDMRILDVTPAIKERLGRDLPESALRDLLRKTYGEVVDSVLQLQKSA